MRERIQPTIHLTHKTEKVLQLSEGREVTAEIKLLRLGSKVEVWIIFKNPNGSKKGLDVHLTVSDLENYGELATLSQDTREEVVALLKTTALKSALDEFTKPPEPKDWVERAQERNPNLDIY
ncbi:MAG: hypothetical protein WC783_05000 [Candidatus Paceibacterota bacterium]|jgi:hypothetical protein